MYDSMHFTTGATYSKSPKTECTYQKNKLVKPSWPFPFHTPWSAATCWFLLENAQQDHQGLTGANNEMTQRTFCDNSASLQKILVHNRIFFENFEKKIKISYLA